MTTVNFSSYSANLLYILKWPRPVTSLTSLEETLVLVEGSIRL